MDSDACNSAEDIDLLKPDSSEPDIQVSAPCTKCCTDSMIYQPQSSSLLLSMSPFLLDFNEGLLSIL